MEDALVHYRQGTRDIQEAAAEAGLAEWDFLTAAQATPDPVGPGLDKGLRPFVRDRL